MARVECMVYRVFLVAYYYNSFCTIAIIYLFDKKCTRIHGYSAYKAEYPIRQNHGMSPSLSTYNSIILHYTTTRHSNK